eukprot:1969479-Prymnesium_polylepis.1
MRLCLQQVHVSEVRKGSDGPRTGGRTRTGADGADGRGRVRTGADGSVQLLHNHYPYATHM